MLAGPRWHLNKVIRLSGNLYVSIGSFFFCFSIFIGARERRSLPTTTSCGRLPTTGEIMDDEPHEQIALLKGSASAMLVYIRRGALFFE